MSAMQATFQKQVKALCTSIEEIGNPFLEESEDLLVLDRREIRNSSVADTVRRVEEIGKAQFEAYVTERFEKQTISLFDPIKGNEFHFSSVILRQKQNPVPK